MKEFPIIEGWNNDQYGRPRATDDEQKNLNVLERSSSLNIFISHFKA